MSATATKHKIFPKWRPSTGVARGVALACFALSMPNAIPGPPLPFDAWTKQGGTIKTTCPSGYVCEESVNDGGLMQRILTDAKGDRLIHQVLDDGVVAGKGRLVSESFVNGNSSAAKKGISTKQSLTQTGTNTMTYNSLINTGGYATPGTPAIIFSQNIKDTTPEQVVFDYTFDFQNTVNAAGQVTGFWYGIRESVLNSAIISGAGANDRYAFVLRRAAGDYVRSAGSAALSAAAGNMGGGAGGGAGGGGMGGAAPAPAPATPAPVTPVTPVTPAPAPVVAPPAPGAGGMGGAAPAPAPVAPVTPVAPAPATPVVAAPVPVAGGGGGGGGMGTGGGTTTMVTTKAGVRSSAAVTTPPPPIPLPATRPGATATPPPPILIPPTAGATPPPPVIIPPGGFPAPPVAIPPPTTTPPATGTLPPPPVTLPGGGGAVGPPQAPPANTTPGTGGAPAPSPVPGAPITIIAGQAGGQTDGGGGLLAPPSNAISPPPGTGNRLPPGQRRVVPTPPPGADFAGGGGFAGMGGGGGGPGGGTVNWNAGNIVQVIWIGGDCANCAGQLGGGMGGGMGGGSGAISFQAYDNLSESIPAIITRSIFTTAPFGWVTNPFGPQPTGP